MTDRQLISRDDADGWLARPVHSRVPMRRSTLGILVAFVVLGALYLWTRPTESARAEQAEKSAMVLPSSRGPTGLLLTAASQPSFTAMIANPVTAPA